MFSIQALILGEDAAFLAVFGVYWLYTQTAGNFGGFWFVSLLGKRSRTVRFNAGYK
jgi:hypothetical protein